MSREEVEVGSLKKGDKCWCDGWEWVVESVGNKFVHLVNNTRGHFYPDYDEIVETAK